MNHKGLAVSENIQVAYRSYHPNGFPVAPAFDQTFLEFIDSFYTSIKVFTWSHLWFLVYLLVFTVLFLIPVRGFKSYSWVRALPARLVPYIALPFLIVSEVLLRPEWPESFNLISDWANVARYSIFFLFGALVATNLKFEDSIHTVRKQLFVVGVLASISYLLGSRLDFSCAVIGVFSATASWSITLALKGFAYKTDTVATPILRYLSKSVLPVYIIHHVFIVSSAYWIEQTALPLPIRMSLVLAVAVTATLALYHFVISRTTFLGFLLGAKPLRC